jgi:hypothetical protein
MASALLAHNCEELISIQGPPLAQSLGDRQHFVLMRDHERHAARIEDAQFGLDQVAEMRVIQKLMGG